MDKGPTAPAAATGRHCVTGFLRSMALYVEARGRLLQIEAQETGVRVSSLAAHVVITLASVIIGWMLAAPAVVWMIAEKSGWHWTHVALCGGGAHLIAGVLLLIVLKAKLKRLQFFEETFNQFRRDREWLANNTND
ncbi:MAG: phage holin family protein [Prosthecobacter sp.]